MLLLSLLLQVQAAAPLSTEDSSTLCSVQPLLATSVPQPSATLQSAITRLHKLSDQAGAEAAAALPGLPTWCHKGTTAALARALAVAQSNNDSAQAATLQSDRTTLSQLNIGDVRVLRSWDLPSTTLLNASTASPAAGSAKDDLQRGYHRHLHTTILVSPATPLSSPVNATSLATRLRRCEVLLLESVPSTLYFDLYQLAELAVARARTRQTYPSVRALAYGDIDVEAGAESSPAHALWLIVDQPQWRVADKATGAATLHLQLPIHARYQAAQNVTCDSSLGALNPCLRPSALESPRVFLRCPSPSPSPLPSAPSPRPDGLGAPPLEEKVFQHGTGEQARTDWLALHSQGNEVRMSVPIASLQNRQSNTFGCIVERQTAAVSRARAHSLALCFVFVFSLQ